MRRMLLWCAALAAFPLACRAESTTTATEMIVRLTVQPMAAPKPALRYLLLPDLQEMQPGNPIPNYLKCILERDAAADRDSLGGASLRLADRAARMDKPDWQILPKLRTDGISLLLPDLQKMRELAAQLQERFRSEVALRRFDDAIRTAKTMFALARHMGEHPSLIGDLVAMAIANVAILPLEEMLEQPGCPNLYWALTNLPIPLISLEKGIEGERVMILAELRDLDEVSPMSPEQIKKVAAYIDRLRDLERAPDKRYVSTRVWLFLRTRDEAAVRAARRRLVEVGLPEERVQRFPADQVILLDEKREYQVRRDDIMKLMALPPWQAEALLAATKPVKEPALFEFFVPVTLKVRRAQGRQQQRIALLRHVEVLRMYAADHGGKLPEKLADCTVPLPDDPFTGKPFPYKVEGTTAHLRGTPPPGEKNPAFNVRFEVAIPK